jgi:hypothetical protein
VAPRSRVRHRSASFARLRVHPAETTPPRTLIPAHRSTCGIPSSGRAVDRMATEVRRVPTASRVAGTARHAADIVRPEAEEAIARLAEVAAAIAVEAEEAEVAGAEVEIVAAEAARAVVARANQWHN